MTMHLYDYQLDVLLQRHRPDHQLYHQVSHVLRPRAEANATRRSEIEGRGGVVVDRRSAQPNRTPRFGEPEHVSGAGPRVSACADRRHHERCPVGVGGQGAEAGTEEGTEDCAALRCTT